MRSLHLLAIALLLGAGPLAVLAGQEVPGQAIGGLRGEVAADDVGVPLVGVRIRLLAPDGSVLSETASEARGVYRFEALTPGPYAVSFSLPGWETHREEVSIRAGQTTRLAVTLTPRPYVLDPLTVSGSRHRERLLETPASVSLLDGRAIRERPARTLLDHMEGLAGVDLIRTGLETGYLAARGFNNLFSAPLLMLVDHRIAHVPSLRANIPRVISATNLDIERVEIARGPASALYGPNAPAGVLHVFTRSPIDDPGLALSVAGGGRKQGQVAGFDAGLEGLVQVEGRLAARFGERVGAKLSGRFFRGTDWRVQDSVELATAEIAAVCLAAFVPENPACQTFAAVPGQLPEPGHLARIGDRDFRLGHWTLDARTDWRPRPGAALVVSTGIERTENSFDQTPLGTSQTRDAVTWYAQARAEVDDLAAQAYLVKNDVPRETFLLRSGQPGLDRSLLAVGQLQHGRTIGGWQRLLYGVDVLRTVPVTEGLLNGIHEERDAFTEVGAFAQSETRLGPGWDLILALRGDHHSVLDGVIISPRLALVHSPAPGHQLRATLNRAYTTPGTGALFADLFAQRIPLGGPFSYGLRAQGTAGRGFTFERLEGRPAMKSPFAPLTGMDPTAFLPATTEQLYTLARELLRASGSPAADLMDAVGTPSEAEVRTVLRILDPGSGEFVPLPGGPAAVQDLPGLKEETTTTFEIGYKGLIRERLRLSVDLHYTRKDDFLSPFQIASPNAFLDGEELVAFFVSRGVDEETARAVAIGTDEQPGVGRIPLGVLQPRELSDPLPNLFLTVRNFGSVDLFGADLEAEYVLSERWSLELAASVASDRSFDADGLPVALNAPSLKARAALAYRDAGSGLHGRVAYRAANGYPALSGVFAGQVEGFQTVDLLLGAPVPRWDRLELQLEAWNLFDEAYRTFPGAPELGRLFLIRLVYGR